MRRTIGDSKILAAATAEAPGESRSLKEEFEELRRVVETVYEQGTSLPEAEKLAARFSHALMLIAVELERDDLDMRMSKNGHKTMRAKVYLDEVSRAEKKPTEAQLDAVITTNKEVCAAQDRFERAQSHVESLMRYFEIFRDAHIYFRGIAKGRFEA